MFNKNEENRIIKSSVFTLSGFAVEFVGSGSVNFSTKLPLEFSGIRCLFFDIDKLIRLARRQPTKVQGGCERKCVPTCATFDEGFVE